MAHALLRELDEEYKKKRAQVIAKNYDQIVLGIHEFFQSKIISLLSILKVKEIIKFDYMTNLELEGDKHLWVNFADENDFLNNFKIFIDSKNTSYCILNKKKYLLNEIGLSTETIEEFSRLCLGEFRRGYDKPEDM